MPRSRICCTRARKWSPMKSFQIKGCNLHVEDIWKHLYKFKVSPFLKHQFQTNYKLYCSNLKSSLARILKNSFNSLAYATTKSTGKSKDSFVNTTNNNGPRLDLCGTPVSKNIFEEHKTIIRGLLFIFVRCYIRNREIRESTEMGL